MVFCSFYDNFSHIVLAYIAEDSQKIGNLPV